MKKVLLIISLAFIPVFTYAFGENYLDNKIVLAPYKKAEIAPLVNAAIIKYEFKLGEKFKKGDIIVLLDDRIYKQLYMKSRSELFRTQESLKYLDKVYKHNRTLYEKNAVGQQELEESKVNMIKALADNEHAKANYEIAKINLDACKIKAPFSGRVIEKLENEHDFVREGQPIIEIADDNKLLAILNLPSEFINRIKTGMKLKFKIDENGEEVEGKVYSVSGAINPGSRTLEVKTLIENKDHKLRIGMSGILVDSNF